MMMVSEMC